MRRLVRSMLTALTVSAICLTPWAVAQPLDGAYTANDTVHIVFSNHLVRPWVASIAFSAHQHDGTLQLLLQPAALLLHACVGRLHCNVCSSAQRVQ